MRFFRTIILIFLATFANMPTTIARSRQLRTRLVDVAPGYSRTSVNTAVFRNSPLVTHGRWQFICFYDADGHLTLGKRRSGSTRWLLKRSAYKANVADAHNVASMGIDGEGYLHVSFDHHGNTLRYCRSIRPLSLDLGQLEEMTGRDEQGVTYPEFYPLSHGDLLFAYRSGASGRGNLVMNRYDVKAHRWQRVQDVLIDGENERNAYWQLTVDHSGVIHLSWVWRETWMVETNHDLCYARSRDNGLSWERSDGTPYALPIRQANAEVAWHVPQNSELINQTSMSCDSKGRPYIATYWRDSTQTVPQYRLVWHDGTRWRMEQVSARHTAFTLKGGGTKMIPIARPRIVVDGRRIVYLFRDAERGSRVSAAVNADLGRAPWSVTDLTAFSVDAWEPAIDVNLWNTRRRLNVFVQATHQGDGERQVEAAPEMVRVMEVR